jgi:ribosomal protein S18 acetylase RimI-like enzyme
MGLKLMPLGIQDGAMSQNADENRPPALTIRAYLEADEAEVVALWTACGLVRPANDPRKDIARKLAVQRDLFLVGILGDRIVATVMAGYDGHRGWINYLAVDPARRRLGLARSIIVAVEERLRRFGCAKINLQIRTDNRDAIAFYQRIGFGEDAVLSMGKRLERDDT